jgi:hypothetical protein
MSGFKKSSFLGFYNRKDEGDNFLMGTMVRNPSFQGKGNSSGSYTTARTNSGLRQLERERAKSISRSEFLRREEAIGEMVAEICSFLKLTDNWDSYGAEAPSEAAIRSACRFVGTLGASPIFPSRAMPSSEGGVGLRFKRNQHRALLEFFNTDEIGLILYQADGSVEDTSDQLGDSASIAIMIENHLTR